MVLKSKSNSLKSKTRRVTFGSTTIIHIPQKLTSSSLTTSTSESEISVESNILITPPTTPTSEINMTQHIGLNKNKESHLVMIASQDSDSSLLLTQAALSFSFDDDNNNKEEEEEELVVVEEEEEQEFDEENTFPPAAEIKFSSNQFQMMSSVNNNNNINSSHFSESNSPDYSLNISMPPAAMEREVLGEISSLSSSDINLTFLNNSFVESDDAAINMRLVKRRIEKEENIVTTLSNPFCVFCHESNGTIEYYDGHYFHLTCAFWCPEVYYNTKEGKLKNINAALERCQFIKCAYCRLPGAPIGCVNEKCQRSYHLHCAVNAGVSLNEKTFELYCPKHSIKH